jgi:putative endonuclease
VSANPDWQVYIVECADKSLYTGIARDLDSRIEQHNAGNGAKYTRGRMPVRLLYCEPHPDRGSAQSREATIKRLSRTEKLNLIATAPRKP